MALVLALLLTTLCGVHAASIPDSLDTLLASKSDNKLEKRDTPNLDKIRRSVLDDMKRMLDSQLAALFESAVTRKAGSQTKRSKPKTKSRPTIRRGDFESMIPEEEPQNSEFIKVLTDDSLQDPSDELLRNAVDQLLKDDEGEIADNIDNSEVYNNKNQLNGDNSTNNSSEEFHSDDASDDATLPFNTTENARKKGKSNKKGISHVIIEHLTESNKNDDYEKKVEDILDLDKILKSALKDYSASLSREDENSGDKDNEDIDSGTTNHYPEPSHENEQLFTTNSESVLRIHDPKENRFQFDGINNVDVDENTIRTEKPVENSEDNYHNGEFETRQTLTNDNNYKNNHHKHIHQHRKQSKGRQPINYNASDENHTLIMDDINRDGKDIYKDDNDTEDLKLEENEVKKDHNKRQRLFKKNKNRSGKKHPNKKRHSKRRSSHDKHKHHNDNKTHDHEGKGKGHHLIVRLISGSDGSNESKLDTMYETPTHKKTTQSVLSDLREGLHQDSKKNMYNRDNYESSESRRNAINEENASQDDSEDKNNVTKIENPNSKEEQNNIMGRDNITNEDYPDSKKDYFIERKKITKDDSSEINDEQVTREGNKNTVETEKGMEENNTDYKDKNLIENERSVEDSENDVISRAEKVASEKSKPSKEIDDTEAKTSISDLEDIASDDEEVVAQKDKRPKNDETHRCHHELIGNKNDDTNIIHDLLHNKEMRKSYSLSLTLSTK